MITWSSTWLRLSLWGESPPCLRRIIAEDSSNVPLRTQCNSQALLMLECSVKEVRRSCYDCHVPAQIIGVCIPIHLCKVGSASASL